MQFSTIDPIIIRNEIDEFNLNNYVSKCLPFGKSLQRKGKVSKSIRSHLFAENVVKMLGQDISFEWWGGAWFY